MRTASKSLASRFVLLGLFVYFVLYPEDVAALIRPLVSLLSLSQAISPWLYGIIGLVIISWTMIRIWGRKAPLVG